MIDIDKLDKLPKRESISRDLIRRYGVLWNTKKYGYRCGRWSTYSAKANHIITKWVGKDVDAAYSEYLVKTGGNIDTREVFKGKFEKRWYGHYRYYKGWYSDFSVIDGKIVDNRCKGKGKFPQTVKSWDYEAKCYYCGEWYDSYVTLRQKYWHKDIDPKTLIYAYSGYEKTFDKPCKKYYQMLADKKKKHPVKIKKYTNLSIPKTRKKRWLWSTYIQNRTVDELLLTSPFKYRELKK